MDKKLIEAFEVCVRALETGADLESVLKRYPDLAVELRPLLETADRAIMMSVSEVPQDAIRRGRTKILQQAAVMRKAAAQTPKTGLFFRRWATSIALALVFLLGGTGVVKASSSTLPGDNLYPVKRAWEDVRLWFRFNPVGREVLESEYEQERLDEIGELLAEGREETITFSGFVTGMEASNWIISDVPVQVTANTKLPFEAISIGAPVSVVGRTNEQGFIQAQTVSLLEPGASLPPLESEELEKHREENSSDDDENEKRKTYKFQGVITSQQGNIWIINGQQVNVAQADIGEDIAPGSFVEFEGYYNENRDFIVTRIELKGFSPSTAENENLNTNTGNDDSKHNDDDDDDGNDNTNNDNGGDDDNESNNSNSKDDDKSED
jgi:hypothetical protein